MKIILPPNYREFDEPLIFLAGPIKGAPRWQNEAIKILEKLSSEIVIASPSWRIDEKYFGDNKNWEVFGVLGNAEHFRHNKKEFIDRKKEQPRWELFYQDKAAKKGVNLFWMPKQIEETFGRGYARTTRIELGRYSTMIQYIHNKVVIGIEDGFEGEGYARTYLDVYNIKPVYSSLEETCKAAIEKLF